METIQIVISGIEVAIAFIELVISILVSLVINDRFSLKRVLKDFWAKKCAIGIGNYNAYGNYLKSVCLDNQNRLELIIDFKLSTNENKYAAIAWDNFEVSNWTNLSKHASVCFNYELDNNFSSDIPFQLEFNTESGKISSDKFELNSGDKRGHIIIPLNNMVFDISRWKRVKSICLVVFSDDNRSQGTIKISNLNISNKPKYN